MNGLFQVLILISLIVYSCGCSNNRSAGMNTKVDSISVIIDTNYSPGSPEVTLLPFPNVNPDSLKYSDIHNYINPIEPKEHVFFDLKTRKNKKFYHLPNIKRLQHIIVDSALEVFSCPNQKSLDSLLHFKKYQIRFPNIGEYECYYVCDFDSHDTTVYLNSDEIQNYCRDFSFNHSAWYGFLIVFDPHTSEAKVIELFNSFHACSERRFYIRDNHSIFLIEIERSPNGRDIQLGKIRKKYEVSILEDGEVNINRIVD
jgi:hypothetical protein